MRLNELVLISFLNRVNSIVSEPFRIDLDQLGTKQKLNFNPPQSERQIRMNSPSIRVELKIFLNQNIHCQSI